MIEKYPSHIDHPVPSLLRLSLMTMPLFALHQSIGFSALSLVFWYAGKLLVAGEIFILVVLLAIFAGGEALSELFPNPTSMLRAWDSGLDIFRP